MKNKICLQHISILTLTILLYLNCFAQKQANKQEKGIFAPAELKIDGIATEWGNQFMAHNGATNIYYTLANDRENLYLVVHATHPRVIEKIMDVGVTLTINTGGKNDDKAAGNVSVTYPQINRRYTHDILVKAGDKANFMGGMPRLFVETLTRTDSTVALANKVFAANATTIKVKGINTIADTLISVYNEQHIKAAAMIDNKGCYTGELAIPLKYLGITNGSPAKFVYHIKLLSNNFEYGSTWSPRDPATGARGEPIDADPDLNSTTDFSGEYTLAKKQ